MCVCLVYEFLLQHVVHNPNLCMQQTAFSFTDMQYLMEWPPVSFTQNILQDKTDVKLKEKS